MLIEQFRPPYLLLLLLPILGAGIHDTFSATPWRGWAVSISASGGKRAFPASDRCGHSGKKNTAPGVTPGSQKTGCANRGLHVWTVGESTPSAALDGPDCRIPGRVASGADPINLRGLKPHSGRTGVYGAEILGHWGGVIVYH